MYCDQPSLLTRDPGGGVNEEIPHIKLHVTAQSGPVILVILCHSVCVFFPFILDIKFVGRTSRSHTQEESRTGFLIPLLSAVRALIFLARRIQPFLSLVGREVEFCVLTI